MGKYILAITLIALCLSHTVLSSNNMRGSGRPRESNRPHKTSNSYPQDGSYPQDNSYPQDGSYPQDNSYPQDGSYPQDSSYPQDDSYPQDGSYPQDDSYPQDGSYPQDNSYSDTTSYPQDGSYPNSASDATTGAASDVAAGAAGAASDATSGAASDAASEAASDSSSTSSTFASECLSYQNPFRTALGLSSLTWSAELAAGAQQWADTMASTGDFKHSGGNFGENIAYGTTSYYGLQGLFEMWTNEKQYYIPGSKTPNSSTDPSKEVGHYTQIVWKGTSQVGCGVGTSGSTSYLCCRYLARGNIDGQAAY